MSKLNINGLLKQYGFTQKELSECTGINKNTISKYCNDTFENINKTHIDLMCKFFDCTPNDLFIIDKSVHVYNPSSNFYNNIIENNNITNENIKEISEIYNTSAFKKFIDFRTENSNNSDLDFKVDNNIDNLKFPYLKEQEILIKQILEYKIKDEIKKQFSDTYNEYIKNYIKEYLTQYFISTFCNNNTVNKSDNKNFSKEFIKKYKDFKNRNNKYINKSNTNDLAPENWEQILSTFANIYGLNIKDEDIDDEVEPCINKKKDYIKKD